MIAKKGIRGKYLVAILSWKIFGIFLHRLKIRHSPVLFSFVEEGVRGECVLLATEILATVFSVLPAYFDPSG